MSAVVVEVVRLRCGHNARLGSARIAKGEPYVHAHHTDTDFSALCVSLARTGHTFTVKIVDRHVSLLEWMNAEQADNV